MRANFTESSGVKKGDLAMRKLTKTFAIPLLLASAACTTSGAKLSQTVAPLRTGLTQADEQSSIAFARTNEMARALNVNRVLELKGNNLREADFPRPISLEAQEEWDHAFDALDSYLQELQNLVDPARSAQTTSELDALADQLRTGRTQIRLPGASVAAFNSFAGALVQARAERTAIGVMRRTDTSFNEVMGGMADAIGRTDRDGLRMTVRAYWEKNLSDLRAEYTSTSTSNADLPSRRALINAFINATEARDAQLRDLSSIQSSLLALGQAHNAAARGDGGDALFWVQRVSTWLEDTKTRAQAAADKEKAAAAQSKEASK